eukprot:10196737-Alexandrium_andersonii.AAC.1
MHESTAMCKRRTLKCLQLGTDAECVCVRPSPADVPSRHARTPGWDDGGQAMFRYRCSPEYAGLLEPMLGGPSCSGEHS